MGKSSQTIIGFKYFLGIHMGICRGPVDALVEIRIGDRKAWPVAFEEIDPETGWHWVPSNETVDGSEITGGQMTWTAEVYADTPAPDPATESSQIRIFQPELFGGDKKEGGVVGYADVMMGESTQG